MAAIGRGGWRRVRPRACSRMSAFHAIAAFATLGVRRWAWSAPVVSYGKRLRGTQEVPEGLRYCVDFVSPAEESELLQIMDNDSSWMRQIRRAQQFFGLVYYQTSQDIPELQPTADSPASAQHGRPLSELPSWLLPRLLSLGLFQEPGESGINQVQANEYLEVSGIGTHVEDPAAGPTLATLSLLEPIQLTLQKAIDGKPVHKDARDPEDCIKFLLEPRSLLVLQGPSRYEFSHAIRQSKLVPLRDGSTLRRGCDYRRVSLTFRGILADERSSSRMDTPEGYHAYEVPRVPPNG
eukprot:TRINITY_DN90817_c0_g1_i1.p1 TRINITY_DN90817_c0_g1~~TRINITY_DN90817_c0_g1_i1.p1  ORF type:complete len:311 (-),score=52.23 TRINITY_DN90817_c0_g1_i1:22-903(-)